MHTMQVLKEQYYSPTHFSCWHQCCSVGWGWSIHGCSGRYGCSGRCSRCRGTCRYSGRCGEQSVTILKTVCIGINCFDNYRISSNSICMIENSICPRLVSAPAHSNNWGHKLWEAPREKLMRMEEAGSCILVAKLLRVLGKSDTSQLLVHNWCPHTFCAPSQGVSTSVTIYMKLIVSTDTIRGNMVFHSSQATTLLTFLRKVVVFNTLSVMPTIIYLYVLTQPTINCLLILNS